MGANRWGFWIDLATRVAAGLALLAGVFLGSWQYRQQQCFRDYANASAVATLARVEAAEADRRAQDQMFNAVARDPRSSLGFIRAYNAARAAADAKRAENPPPPPPAARC